MFGKTTPVELVWWNTEIKVKVLKLTMEVNEYDPSIEKWLHTS